VSENLIISLNRKNDELKAEICAIRRTHKALKCKASEYEERAEYWKSRTERGGARIDELMSMFSCKICYDRGWIMEYEYDEDDDPVGDPVSERKVACPDWYAHQGKGEA
jgi:hypothetical protein